MKIEVNKNELERALIALGKLISRMSPIPEHKSLLVECKDGKVCFSTRSPSEQMTFRTACVEEVEFRCIVGFDEFRDAVCGYRNKALEIEDNEGTLRVGERTLFPMSGVECGFPMRVNTALSVNCRRTLSLCLLRHLRLLTGTILARSCRESTCAGRGSLRPTARNC